jgi:prevent-host-death family protein
MYEKTTFMYDPEVATFSSSDARQALPEVIELAQREAVTIEKHGRPVAVVISPARHEELLEAWEETQDVAAFDAARADDTVPWEQVKADLGWT